MPTLKIFGLLCLPDIADVKVVFSIVMGGCPDRYDPYLSMHFINNHPSGLCQASVYKQLKHRT